MIILWVSHELTQQSIVWCVVFPPTGKRRWPMWASASERFFAGAGASAMVDMKSEWDVGWCDMNIGWWNYLVESEIMWHKIMIEIPSTVQSAQHEYTRNRVRFRIWLTFSTVCPTWMNRLLGRLGCIFQHENMIEQDDKFNTAIFLLNALWVAALAGAMTCAGIASGR